MASWEDGPEYAPRQRPTAFAEPDAAPLQEAPQVASSAAAAPAQRPQFGAPTEAVALEQLVPPRGEVRDPQLPFEVASSALTAEPRTTGLPSSPLAPPPDPAWTPAPSTPSTSAWGAVHSPPRSLPGLLPPQVQPPQRPAPPPTPGAFPTPGTPAWFGPGPAAPGPVAPQRVTARAVLAAATPGVCITLLLGGVLESLSPILLAVAFALSSRVTVAARGVRLAFGVALGALAFFAVIGIGRAFLEFSGFSDWWAYVGGWSVLTCWATLVAVLLLVTRALGQGAAPPPPRSPWG